LTTPILKNTAQKKPGLKGKVPIIDAQRPKKPSKEVIGLLGRLSNHRELAL